VNLTDISTIKALCAEHGFALSKNFGQNFIVNPGVCPKIVEASGIDAHYGVLEIGPGIGVLTKELCARAKKVVAVEIDQRLPALLEQTLADCANFTLVQGDVLKLDLPALIEKEFAGMPVAVCANLPYYITSPIVMKLLEERLPIEHITVMVQKEAAERLCAAPGTRAAGAVSYAVHYYATPKVLFTVQPGSFYPPPKVTSAVIRLALHKTPPVAPRDEHAMFRLIRAAFSQRRKTLANAAAAGLGVPKQRLLDALTAAGLPLTARPEQLTLQDYAALSDALLANDA
jgi:16S rRNA (adenine1518-N6/adenine1519-N6)-dimethyltransferase